MSDDDTFTFSEMRMGSGALAGLPVKSYANG